MRFWWCKWFFWEKSENCHFEGSKVGGRPRSLVSKIVVFGHFGPLKNNFFKGFVFAVQLSVNDKFSENFVTPGSFLLILWPFLSEILA